MKKATTVTITKAMHELLTYESTLFYEHAGVEKLTPAQEAKLRKLDKKATEKS
jgi:hypothetical protein